MFNMSQIMTEAHARAKEDFAWHKANRGVHEVARSYSYFMGLQMRSGFANARAKMPGALVSAFMVREPARWAGTPSRR